MLKCWILTLKENVLSSLLLPTCVRSDVCIYIYVNVVFISLELFYIKFIQITLYYVIILYYFILHYILFLIYYLLAIYSKVAMVRLNWRGALATRQFLKRDLWERLMVEVAIPWNICFNLIYIFFGFMLISRIDRTRSWLEDFFFISSWHMFPFSA